MSGITGWQQHRGDAYAARLRKNDQSDLFA
jgi:hypothetical protein